MRNKVAKQIRKMIGYSVKNRRKSDLEYSSIKVMEEVQRVAQITPEGELKEIERLLSKHSIVADDERQLYQKLKGGFMKYNDSEMNEEIKKDIRELNLKLKKEKQESK